MTGAQRISAFRATDSFAVEAYRLAVSLPRAASGGLAGEIRMAAVRSGGALVAASAAEEGTAEERAHLERARTALVEGRYYLYLARRFGLIDRKRYRALTLRLDAAVREVNAWARRDGEAPC